MEWGAMQEYLAIQPPNLSAPRSWYGMTHLVLYLNALLLKNMAKKYKN